MSITYTLSIFAPCATPACAPVSMNAKGLDATQAVTQQVRFLKAKAFCHTCGLPRGFRVLLEPEKSADKAPQT